MKYAFPITVANTDYPMEDLISEVKEKIDKVEFYKMRMQPGQMYNSGFDTYLMIDGAQTLLAALSLIWAIYQGKIKKRRKGDVNSGVIVDVSNNSGPVVIYLGHHVDSEEEFKEKVLAAIGNMDDKVRKKVINALEDPEKFKKL